MVDFRKLRADKPHITITDPIEIFRRLPKPQGINDLYTSQAEVLKEWYSRWQGNKKEQQDFVIKLHTGGGKTLVGLLIAQSIMNKTHGPVIYLAPTIQLVEQILDKARAYSINAVAYDKDTPGTFPDTFHNGTSVLVCTYQALFNGLSRFGTRWKNKEIIRPAGIILDDAHTAFSTIRDDIFTLKVEKDTNPEDYTHLASIFRSDFEEVGKIGTFEDLVSKKSSNEDGVLEVPYWSWKQKSAQVHSYLHQQTKEDLQAYLFVWPHLRDEFKYCYCFISSSAFVITPIFPLMDAIPTFYDCKNRIYMSATIGDDSALIRTFGTTPTAVAHPIVSSSLAGVSERMILIPERMQLPKDNLDAVLKNLVTSISQERSVGIIILVPSFASTQLWKDTAEVVSKELVLLSIKSLQEGKSLGPFVFANRYDGIDLAGNSCRVLIMAGLPLGASEYDIFRNSVFANTATINYELAQRIEQGMGRGARGPNDYCVVIATGKDLVDYLTRDSNKRLLTSSTRAQLLIGEEASHQVQDEEQLKQTILLCLDRDDGWREYHADRLATLIRSNEMDQDQIKLANVEVKAFKQFRTNLFEEAITGLSQFLEKTEDLDQRYRGWLQQFAARIAYYWENKELAAKYQRNAHINNNHLHRPRATFPHSSIPKSSKQAEEIINNITRHKSLRNFLEHFKSTTSMLTVSATSSQFEDALKDLGSMLGFHSERPEKQYGKGPDVLWILDDNTGLVIEAKSQKDSKNPLTKAEHGQLLNSEVWFKEKYPNHQNIRVSVHPNTLVTKQTPTDTTRVLTLQKLDEMIIEASALFEDLCAIELEKDNLVTRCNTLLENAQLNSADLVKTYLLPFTSEE